jgi:hypothetical protein
MTQEESFDSFYESTCRELLDETLALTGDSAASRSGVRDAYGRAWQHWGRVSRLESPLEWVRPRAHRLAAHARSAPTDGPGPGGTVDEASLPPASEVRSGGARRRRAHQLVLAAAAALVALVAVAAYAWAPGGSPAEGLGARRTPTSKPSQTESPRLPVAGDLLDGSQIRRLGGHGWRVGRTDANTSGDGINSLCQQRRFADPQGYAALVRTFRASGAPRRSAVQTVEVSRSRAQARRAYATTVGWYADCQVARLQVLTAYQVDRVGDRAEVLTLRVYGDPATTVSVAVARTGSVTTSTVGTTVGTPPHVGQVVRTLEDAVRNLCGRSVAGRCVATPTYRAAPPPPAGRGEEKGILATADLPPVGRVDEPWVGTRPTVAHGNPSATTCDRADFRRGGATRTRTRTYLIPEASLPDRFGLSETYGRFRSVPAAARFLSTVRGTVQGCEKRDLSTEVGAERRLTRRSPQADVSQWLLTTTVSRSERVTFRVGLVRVGSSVAQLTFAPAPGADMSEDSFESLLTRAGARLRELG